MIFFVHTGDQEHGSDVSEKDYKALIKYFMATITIPEKNMWVNLSPYEKDRMIPEDFAQTEMGRDLLAQDYLLKQLTASIVYPEDEVGQAFWSKVYNEAYERFGTTEIPINTFNKVWIVPEKAVVYEKDGAAWILKSSLKVLLEEDYVAMKEGLKNDKLGTKNMTSAAVEEVSALSSNIVREIVIPALEKEVNEGKNFALLRQIYNSMILATWYKKALKESLLGQVYSDKSKVAGVDQKDVAENERIYNKYLEAFKKGAYDYIREDYDPTAKEYIPRKYFSGGFGGNVSQTMIVVGSTDDLDPAMVSEIKTDQAMMARKRIKKVKARMKEADLTLTTIAGMFYAQISAMLDITDNNLLKAEGFDVKNMNRAEKKDILTRPLRKGVRIKLPVPKNKRQRRKWLEIIGDLESNGVSAVKKWERPVVRVQNEHIVTFHDEILDIRVNERRYFTVYLGRDLNDDRRILQHVVLSKKGDTLEKIAEELEVDIETMQQMNRRHSDGEIINAGLGLLSRRLQ